VSGFSVANLPFGVAGGRVVTRFADRVLAVGDVVADPVFERPALNDFMAQGPDAWRDTRGALTQALAAPEKLAMTPAAEVELTRPFDVGDYVDFYSSLQHATNLGRLFRPDGEPLLPNWRRLPVGYHGRAGTIVVSGTPVVRPTGLIEVEGDVVRRPAQRLDIELEVGFVVGVGNEQGRPIAVDDVDRHVFGAVLVNDWSARDIQAFEYQPLGPFLGKSFATTISPWVVPLEALRPYLVPAVAQAPEPDDGLRARRDWALDLELEVELNGTTISRTNFRDLYWTFAQQLAHLTSNGASTRPGDLFASGTVSGPAPHQYGSLIELTWRGRDPITLADGSTRTFLEDGDTVVLRGWCGTGEDRVDFGEAAGTILPATG
jgi:fumarylacetoacetase